MIIDNSPGPTLIKCTILLLQRDIHDCLYLLHSCTIKIISICANKEIIIIISPIIKDHYHNC